MTGRSPGSIGKLLVIGVAAGMVGGGLGVGGGIVLVPLLVLVGFDRHRAHATSLAAIVLISSAGAVSFAIDGEVDVVLGAIIGAGGVIGSVLGTSAMHRMRPRTLTLIFGVVLLVAAIRMITGAEPLPGSSDIGLALEVGIGLLIGLAAGFFAGIAGVGGGVVIVPSSVFFIGMEQHRAQGTSLMAIVLTAVAGTLVNRRNERVRLADGLVAGAGGVIGSVAGSRLALSIEGGTLSSIFGFLVLVVAIRTLARSLRSESQPLPID